MRFQALLLVLAVSVVHAEPSLERLKTDSWKAPAIGGLHFTPAARTAAGGAPAPGAETPFFLDPKAAPILDRSQLGASLGSFRLAEQLDRHASLLHLKLGSRSWDVSVAGDAGFSRYYVTLRDGADVRVAPLGDLNRLRQEGVDVQVEPGVVYNVHVSINIFNPVRGSTLEIRPANGTDGPEYDYKTGAILDAVRARSYVFTADGAEYWTLYGTDVDAATGGLAKTRSFLFVQLDGLSTKAWPVAEAALPVGRPQRVVLRSDLALTRTADELQIAAP